MKEFKVNVSNFLSSLSRIDYSDCGRPIFNAAGKYVRFYLAIESPVVSKVILASSIILEVGSFDHSTDFNDFSRQICNCFLSKSVGENGMCSCHCTCRLEDHQR
jgi:hypothetical protein